MKNYIKMTRLFSGTICWTMGFYFLGLAGASGNGAPLNLLLPRMVSTTALFAAFYYTYWLADCLIEERLLWQDQYMTLNTFINTEVKKYRTQALRQKNSSRGVNIELLRRSMQKHQAACDEEIERRIGYENYSEICKYKNFPRHLFLRMIPS